MMVPVRAKGELLLYFDDQLDDLKFVSPSSSILRAKLRSLTKVPVPVFEVGAPGALVNGQRPCVHTDNEFVFTPRRA